MFDEVEARYPSSQRLAYIMIALRRPTQDADHPRVSGMPFAAAAAFQNFRTSVFRDHPLNLQEPLICWTPPSFPVQENDLDPRTVDLVPEQYLIGILPCEPIRGVNVETLQAPGCTHIPQSLQPGAHQDRPTLPCIDKLQLFR